MNSKDNFAQAFEASVLANPYYARFRCLPVCEELACRESMLLFSCFEQGQVAQGTTIYRAGDSSERTMHLILEGEVGVTNAAGEEYERLKQGDVFGLFSFLDEARPHSATVRTDSDVALLRLSRSYFDVITLEDPLLGGELLRFMFRLLSRMALKLEVEYAAMRQFALGRRV